ncbi:MAG: shikimate kinase [Ignavibacteriaceae bacterium]|nr:shikimate kinase [Ignavibacteriaceae bacterium]
MSKNVYLTGFMASGKSTIGPILANTIGWDFFDLDDVIEKKERKKVREIFEEKGEEYFRKVETECLTELSLRENLVISLGGGTVASDKNCSIIKNTGVLIYLKSSPEMAYKRLRFKRDRPQLLFPGDDEPDKSKFINRINLLMEKRIKYYEQADFVIDTDSKPVGKTVDLISAYLRNKLSV